MPRLLLLAIALVFPSISLATDAAIPAAPEATFADAMRAYYAKDYATCASILAGLNETPGPRTSTIAYNAACCLALGGDKAAAFRSLERSISTELVSIKDLEADADLASLRADAAWPAFRAHAARLEDSRLAGVNRALRDELLARRDKDQAARNRLTGPAGWDQELAAEVARTDAENTARMKQVLATHGWPGKSLVMQDGARAAWLLVQHADTDLAFQKQALGMLEDAVAKGEAEAADLAYLTDRVLVGEGKPQRYGTQFHTIDGKLVPRPIEDEANVDLLRAVAGLPSLAAYKQVMQPD